MQQHRELIKRIEQYLDEKPGRNSTEALQLAEALIDDCRAALSPAQATEKRDVRTPDGHLLRVPAHHADYWQAQIDRAYTLGRESAGRAMSEAEVEAWKNANRKALKKYSSAVAGWRYVKGFLEEDVDALLRQLPSALTGEQGEAPEIPHGAINNAAIPAPGIEMIRLHDRILSLSIYPDDYPMGAMKRKLAEIQREMHDLITTSPAPALSDAAGVVPIATLINNNQPGDTNIIETGPNVTLNVGTTLYIAREDAERQGIDVSKLPMLNAAPALSDESLPIPDFLQRDAPALSDAAGVVPEKCGTCNGHGMIGGLTMEGYDSEPCPDCVPATPAPAQPAMGVPRGMALVPINPTDEQINAVAASYPDTGLTQYARGIYQTMVLAHPSPASQPQGKEEV